MKIRNYLFIIVIIAFLLRFWQLPAIPPSLTWDEVAWGYNAYSLGVDGKDEFGRFLPLNYLESFGDFKPPMYAYLSILPVKILGLNEFSTRFISAFFGVLTVFITFFLTKRIFTNQRNTHVPPEYIGVAAAFFLAVSPWHINLSRAAFEANVSTFFLVTGTYFFIKAIQEKSFYLIHSAIFFVLSIYTFNTARVFAPLFIFLLAVGFKKELLLRKKNVILAGIIGLIMLLPTLQFLFSSQASLRFKEVNIFSDISVIHRTNQEIKNDDNAVWSKIIHNRRLTYGVEYLKHYFDNFNPAFLFVKGDGNPKFSTQDVGQLYLWDLPFLIVGILVLFKFRQGYWWVIPIWLILGVLPAGTARETPHALRIETVLPTYQIITAYGFIFFIQSLKNIKPVFKKTIYAGLSFLLLINIMYYLHGYYAHYPREYSGEWQYGYKESIQYIRDEEKKYDAIYITDTLGRPYVYYLFYLKIHPDIFRKDSEVRRDSFGFVNVERVGKYYFGYSKEDIRNKSNALFIDSPENTPPDAKIVKEFRLLNKKVALNAYTL